MSRNTATGAKVKQERKITFKNKEHEIFYNTYLSKCSCQDSYHKRKSVLLSREEKRRKTLEIRRIVKITIQE